MRGSSCGARAPKCCESQSLRRTLCGAIVGKRGSRDVRGAARQVLRPEAASGGHGVGLAADLRHEAGVLAALLAHPNIVRFVGSPPPPPP